MNLSSVRRVRLPARETVGTVVGDKATVDVLRAKDGSALVRWIGHEPNEGAAVLHTLPLYSVEEGFRYAKKIAAEGGPFA